MNSLGSCILLSASTLAFQSSVSGIPPLIPYSNLTPGITRRPEPLKADDRRRVGGRVHAVVGRRVRGQIHPAPPQARPAISRNTTHDKCRPREPTKAITALTKKVAAMTLDDIRAGASSGYEASIRSTAAAPNQATVVRCHAKRNVRLVNASLPNRCG